MSEVGLTMGSSKALLTLSVCGFVVSKNNSETLFYLYNKVDQLLRSISNQDKKEFDKRKRNKERGKNQRQWWER